MQFIEMSGKTLLRVVGDDGPQRGCPTREELAAVGLTEESVIRVNRLGDIELRRTDRWDVIGGLLGEFEERVRKQTGLEWADCGRRSCGMPEVL